jgi:hypothetical protein
VARGGVLAGEGVSGGAGEVPELRGRKGRGEGGLNWGRKGSEGALTGKGRTAALQSESAMRRAAPAPEVGWWASLMNKEGAVCLGSDEGAEKRKKRCRWLLKTGGRTG